MATLDDEVNKHFHFLLLEVTNAVNCACSYLQTLERGYHDRVIAREDHIENLKTLTENSCFSRLLTSPELEKKQVDKIRSVHLIAVYLERIADFCVSIVRQVNYLQVCKILDDFGYSPLFDEIKKALPLILPVLETGDLGGALNVCRTEFELDRLYKENFLKIMEQLQGGGEGVRDLITILFIFRYLERIGDALLNIGETLLFSIIGEKIKIAQFRALQQTLTKSGFADSLANIDYKSILGTRSGCSISKVQSDEKIIAPSVHSSIFKGGSPAKIGREKENIEQWQRRFPDLVPRIYSYHEEEGKAALLEELLPGCTLEEITLSTGERSMAQALRSLEKTLAEIWTTTWQAGTTTTDYMAQVLSRLDNIKAIHPTLFREAQDSDGGVILSSLELLQACLVLEQGLPAPFSIFVHGDLNINNIVFDPVTKKIRFIDLHRSRQADYLQDVSVLLVSFFRMPVVRSEVRKRINKAIRKIYLFASDFADRQRDRTFAARLALGLARSFYTSTRFEFNGRFAREMYLRSHHLMEKIVHYDGQPWEAFSFPEEVLYYEGEEESET